MAHACIHHLISTCPHLHRLVEDAAADLHHLQILLLLVPGALDVSHPAALVLLTGVDKIPNRTVFVEHLRAHRKYFIKYTFIQYQTLCSNVVDLLQTDLNLMNFLCF